MVTIIHDMERGMNDALRLLVTIQDDEGGK